MSRVQTPARVDVEQLVSKLVSLAKRHHAAGRISHAQGVRSAIDLIKRGQKAAQTQA